MTTLRDRIYYWPIDWNTWPNDQGSGARDRMTRVSVHVIEWPGFLCTWPKDQGSGARDRMTRVPVHVRDWQLTVISIVSGACVTWKCWYTSWWCGLIVHRHNDVMSAADSASFSRKWNCSIPTCGRCRKMGEVKIAIYLLRIYECRLSLFMQNKR